VKKSTGIALASAEKNNDARYPIDVKPRIARLPCKLTPEQQSAIPGLVEKGPEAFGFAGGVWTRQRLAEVIAETFGVGHKVSSIGLLLKKSPQPAKTQRRDARQPPQAVAN